MAAIREILELAIACGAALVVIGGFAKFYVHQNGIEPAGTAHRTTSIIAGGIGLIICALILLFAVNYVTGILK